MPSSRDKDRRLTTFARDLRRESTDAERKLWGMLRARNLGGHKFHRQHPLAGYILDFYCAEKKIAVELDGGQHLDPDATAYDAARASRLSELEIHVLRFPDDQALKNTELVAEEILRRLESPSP